MVLKEMAKTCEKVGMLPELGGWKGRSAMVSSESLAGRIVGKVIKGDGEGVEVVDHGCDVLF